MKRLFKILLELIGAIVLLLVLAGLLLPLYLRQRGPESRHCRRCTDAPVAQTDFDR